MCSLQVGLIPCALPGHEILVKREEFPLVGAELHCVLSDVQMLANLNQKYTSNASMDAEIRYVFPLPADASICAFKAVIDGGRTIQGVIQEREKARTEYEQAVSMGWTAALLEQENVEVFQVSLGKLKPKQTIEVHISFISIISHDGSLDSLRLTFPTVIAPRYGTPTNGLSGWFGPGNSKNVLKFSVSVEMTSQINTITSPSHPISMKLGVSSLESSGEFDPMKAHVSLSSSTLLDRDIVLVLSCLGLDKPRCMVESFLPEDGAQEYTDAYALTLVPRFDLPALPAQEYIFLVDRSGSMSGGKMAAVRSALQILLRSLPSRGTSFNIISFGSRNSSLWQRSVNYSADTLKKATAHVDSMTADFGGTEIEAAIQAAFASRVAGSTHEIKATTVFILTDGQAWDLDGVQSAIHDAVARSKAEGLLLRTFCMGIGNAVSKAMCDAIARAGYGTAVFVGEEEKPDHKLMGLLRAARGAVVEDISIDWGVGDDDTSADFQDFEMVPIQEETPDAPEDATPITLFDESNTLSSETINLGPQTIAFKLPPSPRVQQAPPTNSLPPLYPGFRTSLFAIVKRSGNTVLSKVVRIKGSALGRSVVLEVPVSPIPSKTSEKSVQNRILHSLAARALIQSIEKKGVVNMLEADKAEVVRLAERYGLASSQTSFVAIDEWGKCVDAITNVPTVSEGPPGSNLFKNNLRLSRGYMSVGGRGGQPPVAAMALPSGPASRSFGGGRPQTRQPFFMLRQDTNKLFKKSKESTPHAPAPSVTVNSPPTVETIARTQAFDGSFTSSAPLFQLLVQKPHAPATPANLEAAGSRKETLWCTILCIVYLETKFPEDKEVWIVLVDKAIQFVEDSLRDLGVHDVTEKVFGLKGDALRCIV